MRNLIVAATMVVLSGCSSLMPEVEEVKPWERDYLAKPAMQWDANPLQSSFMKHTYYSKEASSGVGQNTGGGCGCNP